MWRKWSDSEQVRTPNFEAQIFATTATPLCDAGKISIVAPPLSTDPGSAPAVTQHLIKTPAFPAWHCSLRGKIVKTLLSNGTFSFAENPFETRLRCSKLLATKTCIQLSEFCYISFSCCNGKNYANVFIIYKTRIKVFQTQTQNYMRKICQNWVQNHISLS